MNTLCVRESPLVHDGLRKDPAGQTEHGALLSGPILTVRVGAAFDDVVEESREELNGVTKLRLHSTELFLTETDI